jgi:hypothetical protein
MGSGFGSAPQEEDADERSERAGRRAGEPRRLDELANVREAVVAAYDDERSVAAERVAERDEGVEVTADGAHVGEPQGELERLPRKRPSRRGVPLEDVARGEEVDHVLRA